MLSIWTSLKICCLVKKHLQTKENECDSKIEICLCKGRKHCENRRKCWLPSFSPFPTMLLKAFCVRVVKSRDFLVTR